MKEKLKKGIYVLPSLFTCSNIAFGCASMMASINGYFSKAAWLLICAIACDILDGRIARITKTSSEFGVQLDSLSDLISFGVAPAIMMYQLVLKDKGNFGEAIAILFVLCSALRLAKFNVKAQNEAVKRSFSGLPTPASAGVLISFVLSYDLFVDPSGNALSFKTIPMLMKNMPLFFKAMPITMVILSLIMVSNIPYTSFKKIKLSKPKTFRIMVLFIILIWLAFTFPQNIIFIIFLLYALSGIVEIVLKYIRLINIKQKHSED
ncbi:MAG: CDP-diacylglycerol--serine O-phosphatidyltransferase [Elusimicrobiota bacterium]|nr:CDP-diacylglycerol--serine O-phosphatidyltransferase [Elusimicrobiota bacterium]